MKMLLDCDVLLDAEAFGAQIIVSRNVRDYRASPIKALRPEALAPMLAGDGRV